MRFWKKKKDENDILKEDHSDELGLDSISEPEKEEPSKFEQFISKFRLDSHRKIERKFMTYCIVFATLFVGIIYSGFHSHQVTVKRNNTTTNLSANVGFSKSSAQFHIGKLWTTPNHSLVVIPLTFESNAFNSDTGISSDAKHYKIKIGTLDKYLKSKPKAQLVLFGNTNQGAIVMQNVVKFPSQVQLIVLEEMKSLSNSTSSNTVNSDLSGAYNLTNALDKYGRKHNITYFKVNPGATNIKVFKKDLSFKQMDYNYLYQVLFGDKALASVKKNIASTQSDLVYKYRQMDEYRRQIDLAGYKVPNNPEYVNDKWRPANAVNPDTGAQSQSEDTSNDNVTMPNDLDRKDGKGTMVSDMQSANNDVAQTDDDNTTASSTTSSTNLGLGAQAQRAQTALQNLSKCWTEIYNDKIQLYVTDNQQLYNIKLTSHDQDQTASVSSLKQLTLLNQVKLSE